MGGGAPAPTPTSTQLQIPQPILDALRGTMDQQLGLNQQFGQQSQQAGQQIPGLQRQYNQSFNSQFAGPNFSNNLDSQGQALVSQQVGANAGQTAAQNNNIAQLFRGNQGAAGVLQAQNNMQGALANNQLPFMALKDQQARQAQNYELGQRAQGLQNAAAGQQFSAGLQGAQFPMQLTGSQITQGQNLMSTLGGLAGLTGTSNAVPLSESAAPVTTLGGAIPFARS